jgi:protein-L-isoaspartate O-methyltransferase
MFASSKRSQAVGFEQSRPTARWRARVLAQPLAARAAELATAAMRRSMAEIGGLRPARHPAAHDPGARWETFYANGYDPFSYRTSAYEQRKFNLTVASLPKERYCSAYEPGCSIGELSERLASRCDELLAADVSQQAVERARERLQHLPNIRVVRHDLPTDHPPGPFDLVLLSELGYYLPKATLDDLLERVVASLEPGGHLVAVHGRGVSPEIFKPGDVVHRHILLTRGLRHLGGYREPAFRIDLFARR